MSNQTKYSVLGSFVVIENKREEIVEYGMIRAKRKGIYLVGIFDSIHEREIPCWVDYPKKQIKRSKTFKTIDACIRYVQSKVLPDSVGTDEVPYLSDNKMISELIGYVETPESIH